MDETKQIKLLETMMEFDRGDPMRIQHFLKVWGFAADRKDGRTG